VKRVSPTSAAWLGLLICLLLTVLAWQLARRYDALEREARFRMESQEVRRAIANRMQVYVTGLQQARGLFSASEQVTREEFRAYVRSMELDELYPGVLGVGFAARVRPGEKAVFEREVRGEGLSGFHIWPGTQGEAYPVVFLEPFHQMNQRAIGYDLFSEPDRREAMERAMRSGRAAATGRLTLVQERGEASPQPGFLILAPAYRGGEMVGFVYSPFRAGDLFRGIFANPAPIDPIGFEVYDGPRPDPRSLLYASVPDQAPAGQEQLAHLEVAGRPWTVRLYASAAFYRAHQGRTPLAVLLVGALVSALVFYLLLANQRHALQLSRLLAQEQSASAEAQRAVRSRDDVLAVASHDLRNPLTSILLSARMLDRRVARDETAARAVAGIHRAANGMRLLLADLVDLARIDSGRLSVAPRPEPAADLARDAVELIAPLAEARGIRLSVELPKDAPRVLGDRERLQQVFSNLLGNAVKFTPPGGSITVRLEDLGDRARFVVADTGPGLSQDEREHVFDRFWQGQKARKEGTGLGLFIVRAIVTAHGGEVSVESSPGLGSTFSFTLPKAP
jgi:two-component system, OmpR family, sensor kinase